MEFKIGDIYNDSDILLKANEAVKSLTKEELDSIVIKNQTLYDKVLSTSITTL